MASDQTLNRAIAAAKAGRKAEARQMLEQILRHDRSNEAAWLWLGGVVETDEERIACLERVVAINPGNKTARRALARLRASAATAQADAKPQPESVSHFASGSEPASDAGCQTPPSWGAPSQPTPSVQATPQSAPPTSTASQYVGRSSPAPRPYFPESADTEGRAARQTLALQVIAGLIVAAIAAIFGYILVSELAESMQDFSLPGTQSKDASEWQRFNSKDGHFDILMPGTPESDVQPVDTPAGTVYLHMFGLETGDFGYFVGYGDYPPELVRNANVEAALDGARDGAVTNVRGKLLSERRIRFQGFSGRELWIEATVERQTAVAQARIILIGNRLYQVVVVGPKERFAESQAERCIDSFRVIR